MHLKSLRVQGFKTFARRTELTFGQGITAIVGPNGSGKSNLVDAVRWALGERNARGLRGHRMEDVIYAGGPGKSPVGMSEVTLVLDNADQRLNVEFTEVEVSRRLFRSGESEYLINGSRARLKDIDALLASTGLRQDGYAVTAQNDIDYVIQAAPNVRRELIEEAAGVRRLREQRQEALNRLADAERDMRRARDLLTELTPRAEELRLQADAAQEYQKLADALKALQGSLARDAWRKAMLQLRRALSRVQAADHKRAAAASAVAEFEPVYAAHRTALLNARDARWRHKEALANLRLRLAESQHQARIAEERNLAAVQALDALQQELARLSESEQAGKRVVQELRRAGEEAQTQLASARATLEEALHAEQAATESEQTLEAQRSSYERGQQEFQRETLLVGAELRQLEGRLQFLADQEAQVAAQLDSWKQRQLVLTAELDARAAKVTLNEAQLSDTTRSLAAIEQRVAEAELALEAGRAEVVEHEAKLRGLEAELGALRTLLDGAERRRPSAKGWARLLEMIDVDAPHRAAVEAALEGWLQGWVASERGELAQGIETLGEAEVARETLLWPVGNGPADELAEGLLPIGRLVRAPDAVAGLLGWLLRATVLVSDRGEAARVLERYPHLRAVTPAGEVITAVSYRGGRSADPVLTVQARIREKEDLLQEERQASLAAADRVESQAQARFQVLAQRQAEAERLEAARNLVAQARGAMAAIAEQLEREEQQGLQLREQQSRLLSMRQQVEDQRASTQARSKALADREVSLKDELARISSSRSEASRHLAEKLAERQEIEMRSALARQRADDLGLQLERAEQLLQSQGTQLSQRRSVEEELAIQPALINEERRQWLERARALEEELAQLEGAELPDDDALSQLEGQVREDEQRNVNLQVELAHAEDAGAAASLERDTAQAEVERCTEMLQQDGQQLTDDELPEQEVDWQRTEREVSRLQRRLDAMGAVNLLAPDEYAQLRDRCQSLGEQLSDLEEASQQLDELRRHLEHDIDERFRTVFQAVAINFQEFFSELFPGGKATLRLATTEQEGNPLDDGVEILAQTPGKRLQPLTLLSGGERALTALAFLFGLQAVTPSPFYVLDEVDAALDDANVARFNRVLKRLSAEQQFLIVTHNHSTMAQAEALYGVTLGEHGISRIVSVRLHQDSLVPVAERSA